MANPASNQVPEVVINRSRPIMIPPSVPPHVVWQSSAIPSPNLLIAPILTTPLPSIPLSGHIRNHSICEEPFNCDLDGIPSSRQSRHLSCIDLNALFDDTEHRSLSPFRVPGAGTKIVNEHGSASPPLQLNGESCIKVEGSIDGHHGEMANEHRKEQERVGVPNMDIEPGVGTEIVDKHGSASPPPPLNGVLHVEVEGSMDGHHEEMASKHGKEKERVGAPGMDLLNMEQDAHTEELNNEDSPEQKHARKGKQRAHLSCRKVILESEDEDDADVDKMNHNSGTNSDDDSECSPRARGRLPAATVLQIEEFGRWTKEHADQLAALFNRDAHTIMIIAGLAGQHSRSTNIANVFKQYFAHMHRDEWDDEEGRSIPQTQGYILSH